MTENEITKNIEVMKAKMDELVLADRRNRQALLDLAAAMSVAVHGCQAILDLPLIQAVFQADAEAEAREDRGSPLPFTPKPKE